MLIKKKIEPIRSEEVREMKIHRRTIICVFIAVIVLFAAVATSSDVIGLIDLYQHKEEISANAQKVEIYNMSDEEAFILRFIGARDEYEDIEYRKVLKIVSISDFIVFKTDYGSFVTLDMDSKSELLDRYVVLTGVNKIKIAGNELMFPKQINVVPDEDISMFGTD